MTIPRLLGHRGASAEERENTLAAFARAVELGAHGVELDVRRTADDRLVVHHDARLPDGRVIVELRADELPEHVPSLAEALDVLGALEVNVEVKDLPGEPAGEPPGRTVELVLAALVDAGPDIVISSFHGPVVGSAVEAGHRAGLLRLPGVTGADAVAQAVELGAEAWHPFHTDVDADGVALAHEAGLRVVPWTVNDPQRARELAALGVDALITDDLAGLAGAFD